MANLTEGVLVYLFKEKIFHLIDSLYCFSAYSHVINFCSGFDYLLLCIAFGFDLFCFPQKRYIVYVFLCLFVLGISVMLNIDI